MKESERVIQMSEKAKHQAEEKVIEIEKASKKVSTQMTEGLDTSANLAETASQCITTLRKETTVINEHKSTLSECEKKKKALTICVEKYREFETSNYKNIKILNEKYNNQWKNFEKIWYKWKTEQISMYLRYRLINMSQIESDVNDERKSEEFSYNSTDWEAFDNKLKQDKFKSKYLDRIDKTDLKSFGINNYQLRNDIYTIIQTLCDNNPIPREKPQKNAKFESDCQGQVMVNSSIVDIDSKYLCPLTKNVMKNPVIAFDQHCYEKEAIISYIHKHKESPITKEKIDDVEMVIDLLVENKSLKNEIQHNGLL